MLLISLALLGLVDTHPNQDCKAEVQLAYSQIRVLSEPAMAFSIEYAVNTEDWDELCQKEITSIRKKNNKIKVYTRGVELYQDDLSLVVINLADQSVFISNPVQTSVKKDQLTVLTTMLDSLFKYMEVQECETICVDNAKNLTHRKIAFSTSEPIRATYSIHKITYWLVENENRIKRIKLEYLPEAELKSLEFELLEINSTYKESPFQKNAKDQVLDKEGRLLPAYRHFELTDKRK